MTTQHINTLYLIDGSSYLYRAYHALPPLSGPNGQPTGAVFGVANMLRKIIAENQPEFIAVIFDAKGKNFRHELYDNYKAHRPPMPEDLRVQIEPLHNLIIAMGVPLISIPGVEADDVIATYAKQAEQQGWLTRISTIDKDMMQLVNPNIKIYNDMSKTLFDEAAVLNKFGVSSNLIVDYLSLIGDKSDNVPGIPGVGPKTAIKWLNDYGSLENLITNAHQITNKAGQSLRDNINLLPLAKQLVTLKTDVDLELNINQLKKKSITSIPLITLLETLGFKSWLNDELKNKSTEATASLTRKTNYLAVTTKTDFENLLTALDKAKLFSFDTETTSLNIQEAQLVGISICIVPDTAYYIPVGHSRLTSQISNDSQLDLDYVINKLKLIFANNTKIKIAHNLKYDQAILNKYNIFIAPPIQDTMLESYVFNSTANRHDLDTLALNILNHTNIKYKDVTGSGAKQINFSEVEINKATEYASEDADIALQLHQHFYPLLQQDEKLFSVYNTIELPLVNVLTKMENKGVLINSELLLTQSKELEITLEKLSNNIFNAVDQVFNLDSPKQLQDILFNKLGLPVLEKTPTGQPSTGESVLQDLALNYPVVNDILEYRGLKKLKSTYTDTLPDQINQHTGRIHTSYQQAVTATGRLSSTNPNLQNIPVKTAEGRRIRQAFIASKDHVLISCDYSQIELRIMAHLSKDKGLITAFSKDQDIHNFTAAEIFNINTEQVTAEQRRYAKVINFGLIYGMSAFGLAKQLNIDNNSAQAYIDLYFSRYPGVKQYMNDIRKFAEDHGYVETLFGRRLYLPEIKAKNFMRRRAVERLAINAPMQGTAADMIKKAMIDVDKQLDQNAALIMQVHDELIVEVHQDFLEPTKLIVINSMQNAAKLDVPVKVSCGVGKNWDEAH